MKRGKKLITFLTAALMAVMMVIPASAAQTGTNANEAVSRVRNGVLEIQLIYQDQTGQEWPVNGGSGFLIGATNGAEYMITNHHVVSLDDELKTYFSELLGVDFFSQSILNQLQIKIVVKRDVTINATVMNYSDTSNMDFAILKLEQPIYDRESLIIDDDDSHVQETMDIYALGFPADVANAELWSFGEAPLYTSTDVNITGGIVSNTTTLDRVKHIRHSVVISAGNSGGPLVDSKGHVVGVNRMGIEDTQYNYSLQISEVTAVLNALGITYRKAEEDTAAVPEESAAAAETVQEAAAEPEIPSVDKTNLATQLSLAQGMSGLDGYTQDSVDALNEAITSAQSVMDNAGATQSEVDAAAAALNTARTGLTENPGPNLLLIIGIIGAVLIVVIVIIVVVLVSGGRRKKTAPVQTMGGPQGRPPVPPAAQPKTAPQQPVPPVPNYVNFGASEGSGETSVLNQGSGETSVLGSSAPQISATLTRRKNGEKIQINKQLFKIGKERIRVDYCIPDNNSISRVHAQIVFKNNAYFIMDMKSTNYTYVNGNKVVPEQEMKLNGGDRIRFADEEFEFQC